MEVQKIQGIKKKKTGIITTRDIVACRWIAEHGVMSIDQLYRAVWKPSGHSQNRYTYDRVKLLKDSGYVREINTPLTLKSYFELTKDGINLCASNINDPCLIPTSKVPLSEIPHADCLTELKLFLIENNRIASWVTDRVLLLAEDFPKERFKSRAAFPDALWHTSNGVRIAVEYERTQKSKQRIESKLQAYQLELMRLDRVCDRVLWIVHPSLERLFSSALSAFPNQHVRILEKFKSEIVLKNGEVVHEQANN